MRSSVLAMIHYAYDSRLQKPPEAWIMDEDFVLLNL